MSIFLGKKKVVVISLGIVAALFTLLFDFELITLDPNATFGVQKSSLTVECFLFQDVWTLHERQRDGSLSDFDKGEIVSKFTVVSLQ
jgi:hypothetical protein